MYTDNTLQMKILLWTQCWYIESKLCGALNLNTNINMSHMYLA